jgi:hypothetical protein
MSRQVLWAYGGKVLKRRHAGHCDDSITLTRVVVIGGGTTRIKIGITESTATAC